MRALLRNWGPVFLWLAGIFYFSAQPDPLRFLIDAIPGAVTEEAPPSGDELADRPLVLSESRFEVNVGALAHVAEYAGLTVLLLRALRAGGRRRSVRSVTPAALVIVLGLALLDETYQGLFPNRGFEWADVSLDLLGAALASAVVGWLAEG